MPKASPKYLSPSPNSPRNNGQWRKVSSAEVIGSASSGVDIPTNTSNSTSSLSPLPNDEQEQGEEISERNGSEREGIGGKSARITLSPPIKARLVELFATFHTHKMAEEIILEEFGQKLTKMQLSCHDPARANCGLSRKLHAYFKEVRERYVQGAADIAITHQTHRLRRLEEVHHAAMRAKDFTNAIKALEVAAKELGGLGDTINVKHSGTVGHVHASLEDARTEVAMRLASLVEKAQLQLPSSSSTAPAPADDSGGIEGDDVGQVLDIIVDNGD